MEPLVLLDTDLLTMLTNAQVSHITRTEAPAATKDDLCSTFGMCEMEMAAKVIITEARRRGTWQFQFGPELFNPLFNSYGQPTAEFAGMLQLLGGGFLRNCWYGKSDLTVTDAFIARVLQR